MFMLLVFLFSGLSARANELKLGIIDAPPMTITRQGSSEGINLEVAREMAKRAKIPFREIQIPIRRFAELSSANDVVFPMTSRNSERENQFRWIGKTLDSHNCFITLKTAPAVESLAQAKKLKKIAVNGGGANETFLKKNGFTNLETANGNTANARKFLSKVVDSWYTSEIAVRHSISEAGGDKDAVVCTGRFSEFQAWIAASLKLPDPQFEALKKAFQDLEREGFIQKVIKKYN